MNTQKIYRSWRQDLLVFRGLTDQERSVITLVLEWFENFRLRHELEDGRDAVNAFWQQEVVPEDRPRETMHLEQWEKAIKWYLDWLRACEKEEAHHRSLPERAKAAVQSACGRMGMSPRTMIAYAKWVARYAAFAGREREMMRVETANRFLTSVVDNEDCAYSSQKQALNAVTFYFKQVCAVENPDFCVTLKKD